MNDLTVRKIAYDGSPLKVVQDSDGMWVSITTVCLALGFDKGKASYERKRIKKAFPQEYKEFLVGDNNNDVGCIKLTKLTDWLSKLPVKGTRNQIPGIEAKLTQYQTQLADHIQAAFMSEADIKAATAKSVTALKAKPEKESLNEIEVETVVKVDSEKPDYDEDFDSEKADPEEESETVCSDTTDLIVKDVNFHGATLKAVQDKDKVIWAGVRWMCEGIGLSGGQSRRQVENISKDFALKRGCRKFATGVFDGNNPTIALQLDYVPLWLAKISITPTMQKQQPELAEKLVQYQLKAKDALAAAFLPQYKANNFNTHTEYTHEAKENSMESEMFRTFMNYERERSERYDSLFAQSLNVMQSTCSVMNQCLQYICKDKYNEPVFSYYKETVEPEFMATATEVEEDVLDVEIPFSSEITEEKEDSSIKDWKKSVYSDAGKIAVVEKKELNTVLSEIYKEMNQKSDLFNKELEFAKSRGKTSTMYVISNNAELRKQFEKIVKGKLRKIEKATTAKTAAKTKTKRVAPAHKIFLDDVDYQTWRRNVSLLAQKIAAHDPKLKDANQVYNELFSKLWKVYGYVQVVETKKYREKNNIDGKGAVDRLAVLYESPQFRGVFNSLITDMVMNLDCEMNDIVFENLSVIKILKPLAEKMGDAHHNFCPTYKIVYKAMEDKGVQWEDIAKEYHNKTGKAARKTDMILYYPKLYKIMKDTVSELMREA